jgi:hypothetical protein
VLPGLFWNNSFTSKGQRSIAATKGKAAHEEHGAAEPQPKGSSECADSVSLNTKSTKITKKNLAQKTTK